MNWPRLLPVLYLKINPSRLSLRWVGTGIVRDEKPMVAINERGKVVAMGQEAESAVGASGGRMRLVNGFAHPRVIVADFDAAGAALSIMVKDMLWWKTLVAPVMVVYPEGEYDGGLSQIEHRALKDLATCSGARKVYITLRDLPESDLLNFKDIVKRAKGGFVV